MPRVTQTELANDLGVTKQAVHKAIAARRLELGEDGRLDLETSRVRWHETSRSSTVTAQRVADEGRPDYHLGRAIRETYLAKLARLEFEERSGKLVEAQKVQAQAFDAGRRIREHLITMGDRIAAQVAAEGDRAVCYQIIMAEVERALDELAPERPGKDPT